MLSTAEVWPCMKVREAGRWGEHGTGSGTRSSGDGFGSREGKVLGWLEQSPKCGARRVRDESADWEM